MVHGAVRHPQSQGLVENQNSLLSKYLEKSLNNYNLKNKASYNWDMIETLNLFTATENNKVHTVTKEIANKLVNETSAEKIKIVSERIQNYYKNIKEKSSILSIGSKVAIIKDIDIAKNKKSLIIQQKHKFSRKNQ